MPEITLDEIRDRVRTRFERLHEHLLREFDGRRESLAYRKESREMGLVIDTEIDFPEKRFHAYSAAIRAMVTERSTLTVGEALEIVSASAEELVERTATDLYSGVLSEIVPKPLRQAVLAPERELVIRWPWPSEGFVPWDESPRTRYFAPSYLPGAALSILVVLSSTLPPGEPLPGAWPPEIAPRDFVRWRGLEEILADPAILGLSYTWSAAAVLYSVFKAVDDDRRIPVIRHSADRAGRAALTVLAAGPGSKHSAHPWKPEEVNIQGGTVELVWNGRRTPVQLALGIGDDLARLDWVAVRGILAELHEDGLRDWLVLHRMAGEQGATGLIRWAWQDHKERTPYARRVTLGKATDSELASATVRRLDQLKRAEVRLYADKNLENGLRPWMRVGPFGLIDIPAGADDLAASRDRLRLAAIKINPAIYSGAKRGSDSPHFMLLAESAVGLPGDALRLLSFLACDWQYERAEDGIVRSASTLWEYAAIREGRRTPRKRWPEATRTLERLLARLAEDGHVSDWSREKGAGELVHYRIRPPRWWVDQVLLGVPPEFGKSLASTPKTGKELKGWREGHGWSQAELASMTGVSKSTIIRAEHRPEMRLSVRLVDALRPL